ncbi:aldehyde ferredoxin oxidoreductase family protein [Desulfotomaculum nigrificans]|uniref:aldehyde ferredoxin oxidoreductase family protein n=1 Tax=Desulfotomaculum nigrificans TaxID=1565 RepID=UPI0001FAEA15|nr:aldehyde ferredoxin oxidoreductase family protein [Desulfotomaculum nigrificans]
MYGYGGNILRINLSTGEIKKQPLDEVMAREWVGQRGFIAKILWDELKPGIDPLGPENKLIMSTGPLAGTLVPAGGKVSFGAKSPATGIYGESCVGGHIAAEMKYAGYDVIILEGQASRPSYIYINDDQVEIKDAAHLWGKGAIQTEKALKDELGEEFQICTIGPAGEKLVKYACISHDFGRQAGRTGMGTVMGSKNIKAIAIYGSKSIPLADLPATVAKAKEMLQGCFAKENLNEWQDYGTAGVPCWANSIGAFPTRNFQSSYLEGNETLDGKLMRQKMLVTDKGCFGCPSPCGKYCYVPGYDVYVEGPEYETTALIGGSCVFTDIEKVGYLNYLCDELGLDTISAGNVIGFAMECYEKGVITKEQVGREIKFGDVESFKFLVEQIVARQGIGHILAEGVKYAAEQFGGDSIKYAIQVKGLEWSGYESRSAPSNMLAYMTCDLGAHHSRAWSVTHDIAVGRKVLDGKAKKVVDLQHIRPFFDLIGCCRLQWVEIGFELEHYPEVCRLVTGFDYSQEELMQISEKVWNLTRAFAWREIADFGRQYDYPPARFYEEAVTTGPNAGDFIPKEHLDKLLDDYYQLRGWDKNGLPTKEKLNSLGLQFVVEELLKQGRKLS